VLKNVSLVGKRILIAEDITFNRDIIKMVFDSSGVELFDAENGEQAVLLFKENEIDIILMDCVMPVMDGFKAVEAIRVIESSSKSRRIPIIAITASTSDEVKQQCLDSGMDDVLHKPFNFDEVLKIVTHYSNET